MDYNLGKLNLTDNQFKRVESLKGTRINGFSQKNGIVTVVSYVPLTDPELEVLRTNLKALPDEPLPLTQSEVELVDISKKEDKDITVVDLVKVLRSRRLL